MGSRPTGSPAGTDHGPMCDCPTSLLLGAEELTGNQQGDGGRNDLTDPRRMVTLSQQVGDTWSYAVFP